MHGTSRQIRWAEDIIARTTKYKHRLIKVNITDDKELYDFYYYVIKILEYIENEKDARALINHYGYAGFYNYHGRRVSTLKQFLIDVIGKEHTSMINKLIELEDRALVRY